MANPASFADRVAAARARSGKSQREVATRMGRLRQNVSRIEQGRNIPPLIATIRLADAIGCDVLDLAIQPEDPGLVEFMFEFHRLTPTLSVHQMEIVIDAAEAMSRKPWRETTSATANS
jgi:transcriptional regulator with XRE-family HTH domain